MTNNTYIPARVSPAVEEWCLQVCKFSRDIRWFELLRSYIRLLPKSIQHSCKSILWHTPSWWSEAVGCAPNHWWKGKGQGCSNSSRLTNSMYGLGKQNSQFWLLLENANGAVRCRVLCDVLAHLIIGRTVLFTLAREKC